MFSNVFHLPACNDRVKNPAIKDPGQSLKDRYRLSPKQK